jgi:UDPglucose--hexose-1-phosphate uridylyltransferase
LILVENHTFLGNHARVASVDLVNDEGVTPTRWTLADGRDLLFFSLPGHSPAPVSDRRPLTERGVERSQLRFDRQTGQWVIIAALRQDRTHKPATDQCPLCPGPSGLTSEVPAPDYDVVVFENRFPSLSEAVPHKPGPPQPPVSMFDLPVPDGDTFVSAPGHGRCEVICFSANHTGSFAELEPAHARLVVDAWRHRTADLMARPGIEQVFCFENRGEEIGVTLTHPHGQIYGYPYLAPRAAAMLTQARAHAHRHGRNLFADILAREVADGNRIVARTDLFTAFVPFAARWPVEVHIYPNRFVRNLVELDDAELDGFARLYLDVLKRFDRMYETPLPYMSALHQYADNDAQRDGYFHVELMSVRRSATKLKYLASSESAMDAFISDVTPELAARRLRGM